MSYYVSFHESFNYNRMNKNKIQKLPVNVFALNQGIYIAFLFPPKIKYIMAEKRE